jgi:uncharacterized membrane protein YbhN (UPF0104 family)
LQSSNKNGNARLGRTLRWITVALGALVLVALVRSLRRDGPAAFDAWRSADVQWSWVVLASAFALAGHLVFAVGWQRLLNDCGVPVSFWKAARIFLASNLGRYLPGGKAWQMGIVGVMAAEDQLPAGTLAATSLFQSILGVVVGAILLLATGASTLGVAPFWFAFPVAGLIGLLAAPALLRALPRTRAALISRLPSLESVTTGTMWVLLWTAAASWIAWGLALYALAMALLPDAGASMIAYVSAWIGPFLAGLVAVVAPAGLGVRDEVMRTMLATSGVPASSAMMLVVVARVWTTMLEVAPAALLLALRPRKARSAALDTPPTSLTDPAL